MKKNVIVVDDFYENPLEVRKLALALPYGRDPSAVYGGENSLKAFWTEDLLRAMERLIGVPLEVAPSSHNGKFRISPAASKLNQDIHFDPVHWSGVLFLNTPEQCRGGTSLWKHKKTGWEELPTPEQMAEQGYTSEDISNKIVNGDGLDRSLWEETLRVPMKFNRLVLFRPVLWHSHTENFGQEPEDSRLIQTFFFVEGKKANAA